MNKISINAFDGPPISNIAEDKDFMNLIAQVSSYQELFGNFQLKLEEINNKLDRMMKQKASENNKLEINKLSVEVASVNDEN